MKDDGKVFYATHLKGEIDLIIRRGLEKPSTLKRPS